MCKLRVRWWLFQSVLACEPHTCWLLAAAAVQSTYVEHLYQHCEAIRRSIHCVNLGACVENNACVSQRVALVVQHCSCAAEVVSVCQAAVTVVPYCSWLSPVLAAPRNTRSQQQAPGHVGGHANSLRASSSSRAVQDTSPFAQPPHPTLLCYACRRFTTQLAHLALVCVPAQQPTTPTNNHTNDTPHTSRPSS